MIAIIRAAGVAALLLATAAVAAQVPSSAPAVVLPTQKAQEAQPIAPPEGEPADHAEVDGFRSAKWGMTDAEVKAAIRKDFNVPPEKLQAEQNAAERTSVLSATVGDLLDGAGPARVSYIFGYSTKKLIQVNILWGTPVDPQSKPERISAAAQQLVRLFQSAGYEPETVVSNARTADGMTILFQGQDAQKRTTSLRLIAGAPPPKPEKGEKPGPTVVLWLSYILDNRNPDIYRLKKGQF